MPFKVVYDTIAPVRPESGGKATMVEDKAQKLTTWTLAAIKARNMALEGYCERQGCGRFYVFNIDGLIEGFSSDWLVPEILPIPCSA